MDFVSEPQAIFRYFSFEGVKILGCHQVVVVVVVAQRVSCQVDENGRKMSKSVAKHTTLMETCPQDVTRCSMNGSMVDENMEPQLLKGQLGTSLTQEQSLMEREPMCQKPRHLVTSRAGQNIHNISRSYTFIGQLNL